MKKSILIIFMLALFAGCSNNDYGIEQISKSEFDEKVTGDMYTLIFLDDDTHYYEKLDELAKEYKKTIYMYAPYQSNGVDDDERATFPEKDVNEFEYNGFYKLKDGKISEELLLDEHLGQEREDELESMLND